MSRILLGWEMGSNLGHLSRLLPLARRLKAHGHSVLVAARDLTLAARMLGPAGIPFIQAPQMNTAARPLAQPASYADLLRYTGWGGPTQLWGMVQAWVNVLRMFNPDVLVLDHSPTALLASRYTDIPRVLMGTGFELPPLKRPLPAFPGFSGSTAENAAKAEAEVLGNANLALRTPATPLHSLSELFAVESLWLTTFAELDHYGARQDERYVGPIGEVENGARLEWPEGPQRRIFAYLRGDTPHLAAILKALSTSGAAVVCYGPGVPPELTEPLVKREFLFARAPVDLRPLLTEASLCVSYSPAGTVAATLLRGIPQLLAPAHLEAQMTAHRVECLGAGLMLRGRVSEEHITYALQRLLNSAHFKAKAAAFAARYRGFDPGHVADIIVEEIESLAARRKQTIPHASVRSSM
jgi:UDP:flavonoid glycosyltransferase YjiC (YdhE family)